MQVRTPLCEKERNVLTDGPILKKKTIGKLVCYKLVHDQITHLSPMKSMRALLKICFFRDSQLGIAQMLRCYLNLKRAK